VQEWRQQFQKLESVNLRYDNQVIVNPDMEGRPRQAPLSASAAKAAAAAGVKPAALILRINPHDKTLPKPAFELSERRLDETKTAAPKKAAVRPRPRQALMRSAKPVVPKREVARHASAKRNSASVHSAALKGGRKKPAQSPMVAHSGGSKPSPAISKQNTGSN